MKAIFHQYKLHLKQPLVLSYGIYHHRETCIVELQQEGMSGYGEATAISYYGYNIHEFINELNSKRKDIEALNPQEPPQKNNRYIQQLFPTNTFLQSALDVAIWDLYAKKRKRTLRSEVGYKNEQLPFSSYTASGNIKNIEQQLKGSWPIIKIKMGKEKDEEILALLENHKSTKEIRIDANGGWSVQQTKEYTERLKKCNITFIEQPLAKGQEEKMEEVKQIKNVKWVADESIQTVEDVERCSPFFDVMNFKLMKLGGITPMLKAIEKAERYNKEVALGCMTESSIGISALSQLAYFTSFLDMDGASLLRNDPGKGTELMNGKIKYSNLKGIGADLIK